MNGCARLGTECKVSMQRLLHVEYFVESDFKDWDREERSGQMTVRVCIFRVLGLLRIPSDESRE